MTRGIVNSEHVDAEKGGTHALLLQLKEDRRNGPHDENEGDDRDLNFRSQRKVLIGRIRLPPSPPLSTSTWPSRLPRSFTEIRFALRPLLTNDRRARAGALAGTFWTMGEVRAAAVAAAVGPSFASAVIAVVQVQCRSFVRFRPLRCAAPALPPSVRRFAPSPTDLSFTHSMQQADGDR